MTVRDWQTTGRSDAGFPPGIGIPVVLPPGSIPFSIHDSSYPITIPGVVFRLTQKRVLPGPGFATRSSSRLKSKKHVCLGNSCVYASPGGWTKFKRDSSDKFRFPNPERFSIPLGIHPQNPSFSKIHSFFLVLFLTMENAFFP